jgi:hypothetical protein
MASNEPSPEEVEARLERLEEIVEEQQETIERQQSLIQQQQQRLDATDTDESAGPIASKFSRRSLLQAAGVVGLAGYGTGMAAADPQGEIGTATDPLVGLYTDALNGGVTDEQAVTSLLGTGLAVDDQSLSAAGAADDHVDVADSGSSIVEDPNEVDFDAGLSASDDGDGTVTVDARGVTVEDSGVALEENVATIDFRSNLDATTASDGEVLVDAEGGSGGGGSPVDVQDSGTPEVTDVSLINFATNLSVSNPTGSEVDVDASLSNLSSSGSIDANFDTDDSGSGETFTVSDGSAAETHFTVNDSGEVDIHNGNLDLNGNSLTDSTGAVNLGSALDTNANGVQADGSVSIDIDANDGSTSETFTVTNNGGGNNLFQVNEGGPTEVLAGDLAADGIQTQSSSDITLKDKINLNTNNLEELGGDMNIAGVNGVHVAIDKDDNDPDGNWQFDVRADGVTDASSTTLFAVQDDGEVDILDGPLDLNGNTVTSVGDLEASGGTTVFDRSAGEFLATKGTSTTDPQFTRSGDPDTGLGFGAADQLDLITGGTRAVSITGNQNLALNGNSITDSGPITVTGGDVRLDDGASVETASNQFLTLSDAAPTWLTLNQTLNVDGNDVRSENNFAVAVDPNDNNATSALDVDVDGTTRLSVDSTGLDVQSGTIENSTSGRLNIDNTTAGDGVTIDYDAGGNDSNESLLVSDNGSTQVAVDSSGLDVRAGTVRNSTGSLDVTPSTDADLSLAADTTAGKTANVVLSGGASGAGNGDVQVTDGTLDVQSGTVANTMGGLTLRTGGSDDVTLDAGGKVDVTGNDIEDGGTTVYDSGNKNVPRSQIEKAKQTNTISSSGTTTIGPGDELVGVATTAAGGSVTVNFPSGAAVQGRTIIVVDVDADASTNNISFTSDSGTVNGINTTISTDNGYRQFASDGANWFEVGAN